MVKKKKSARPPRYAVSKVHHPSVTTGGNYPRRLDLSPLARIPEQKPFVFIYSLNERDLNMRPHPFFPKGVPVPGRKENERYSFVMSLPEVLFPIKFIPEEVTFVPLEISGVRVAVDLINPDNLGTDLDALVPPEQSFSIGNDLARKGVFYSLTKPPADRDVVAAENRLRKYYKDVFDKARSLYWGTGSIPFSFRNGEEVADAARYLGITNIPWERRKTDRKGK